MKPSNILTIALSYLRKGWTVGELAEVLPVNGDKTLCHCALGAVFVASIEDSTERERLLNIEDPISRLYYVTTENIAHAPVQWLDKAAAVGQMEGWLNAPQLTPGRYVSNVYRTNDNYHPSARDGDPVGVVPEAIVRWFELAIRMAEEAGE